MLKISNNSFIPVTSLHRKMYQNILEEGTAYVLHLQICIFMSPHILIYTTVATYFEQCYSNNHAGS